MPFRLIYPDSYIRRAKKFLKKHPEIHSQYKKTLQLMELNPHYPSLRLHGLEGSLKGLFSISINLNYRIVLEMQDEEIMLVDIGKRDQVY